MVTDYDCWRQDQAVVEVANVLAVLKDNAQRAARMVAAFAAGLQDHRPDSPLDTVLDFAIVTAAEKRVPEAMAKLDAVCGRVLRSAQG